jgi:hypothetical protein
MVERGDVAYVGRINSKFIPMVRLVGQEDLFFYLPTYNQPNITLSAGAFSSSLDVSNNPANIVQFQASASDNGWKFEVFNSSNTSLGFLVVSDGILRVGSSGTIFSVSSQDPNSYASGSLLTSVRYKIVYSGDATVYVQDAELIDDNSDFGGLAKNGSVSQLVALSNLTWTFVPTTMSKWLTSTPTDTGSIPSTVRITQCACMDGTGYGKSKYCSSWKSSRGFTTKDDVQDVIYYYSKDGSCGQSYTFDDYYNEPVSVTSSIGEACTDATCKYDEDEKKFKCVEDPLLNWKVILLLVAILIVVIIIIVVVVGFLMYSKNKKKQEQAQLVDGQTPIVVQ